MWVRKKINSKSIYKWIPFDLEEAKIDAEWEPELHQDYMVLYGFRRKPFIILTGYFSKTWYGYLFHTYWGASNLQISKYGKYGKYPDWKKFKKIYNCF